MKYKYYLGLGSNIEPRLDYLHYALKKLTRYGVVTNKSAIYETEPWGNKEQNKFLNAVIRYEAELHPQQLIKIIKETELDTGRTNDKIKWGPRTLDIDILFVEDVQIDSTNLKIPHPYLADRKFVLKLILEITDKKNFSFFDDLYVKCPDTSRIIKVKKVWGEAGK